MFRDHPNPVWPKLNLINDICKDPASMSNPIVKFQVDMKFERMLLNPAQSFYISMSLQLLILFKTLPKIAPKAFCIYCASFAYFFHNAPTVMLQKYIAYLFSPNLWNHREQGEWLIKVSGSCKSLLINPGRKEDRKNEREVCGHSLEHSSKVNILLVQFLVIKT